MVGEKLKEVLVVKDRIESLKEIPKDFKDKSMIETQIGIASRFGHNTRRLIRNIIGG